MLLPKPCLEKNNFFHHHLSVPFHERLNEQKNFHICRPVKQQIKYSAAEHAFSHTFTLKASVPFILKTSNK